MTTIQITQPPTAAASSRFADRFSWKAVLAGLVTAVAVHITLAEAWFGVGLLLVDAESSPGAIVVSSAIASVIAACIALFIGAWVAGRVASAADRTEGALHGAVVWATGAIAVLLLAASAVGAVIGGSAFLLGKGIEKIGAVATVAAPNWDTIRTELDKAIDGNQAPAAPDASPLADRSRLVELLGQTFTTDEKPQQTDAERAELIGLLAAQTGTTPAAAQKGLEQWQRVWAQSVEKYRAAKEQGKVAADHARRITGQAACWSVIAMVLTAVSALFGGALGASCRRTRGTVDGPVSATVVPA